MQVTQELLEMVKRELSSEEQMSLMPNLEQFKATVGKDDGQSLVASNLNILACENFAINMTSPTVIRAFILESDLSKAVRVSDLPFNEDLISSIAVSPDTYVIEHQTETYVALLNPIYLAMEAALKFSSSVFMFTDTDLDAVMLAMARNAAYTLYQELVTVDIKDGYMEVTGLGDVFTKYKTHSA